VVADNIDYGYSQYVGSASKPSTTSEFERLIYGGSPWEKPAAWLQESITFNLQHIRTPLRLETEEDSAYHHWEVYAGLKILHRPVELTIIPGSPHSLIRPWHRLTSQGGSVDWFRFWLKGEEDPDPAKAGQYTRWQAMRKEALPERAKASVQ
jgi:hypothetical protein